MSMSWPYVHLVVNHFPLVLLFAGVLALFMGLATKRRSVLLYAVASITLSGVIVYPVVFTGHKAEHKVERLAGVSKDAVHEHEGAADQALWMVLITGAFAAFAWWRLAGKHTIATQQLSADRRPSLMPAWLSIVLVITSLMALASILMTSYKGGKILHQELVEPSDSGMPANIPRPTPIPNIPQSSASSTAPLM